MSGANLSFHLRRVLLPVVGSLLLPACAQYESERGVDVNWQERVLAGFERGRSTRADVLAALGPPSQLVSLGDETVLYYLNEDAQGKGLVLVLYNRFDVVTRYDRAVFIFDADGRLKDLAGHINSDPDA